MTVNDLLDVITQGGVVGLLVLIVVGGWKRWYVWSWQYLDVIRQRDEWKDLAMRGTGLAEAAAHAAKQATDG